MKAIEKILIIRLSSFGDIIQAFAAVDAIRAKYPKAEIHWLVKTEFAELAKCNKEIDYVWSFDSKKGFLEVLSLSFRLHEQAFTHIYDAHKHLRSILFMLFLRILNPLILLRAKKPSTFLSRPKNRLKRLLLFKFRINRFPWPFVGARSFVDPLEKWGIPGELYKTNYEFPEGSSLRVNDLIKDFGDFICLAPSAAWKMKRWPLEHWKKLVEISPEKKFIVIGGPKDDFCADLEKLAPDRVLNLAGQTTLLESLIIIHKSRLLVSADTGSLHVSDSMNHPNIALIGPTAFGFPGRKKSKVLEVEMSCRPCTKDGSGKCTSTVYQKCMVDIRPEKVYQAMKEKIG